MLAILQFKQLYTQQNHTRNLRKLHCKLEKKASKSSIFLSQQSQKTGNPGGNGCIVRVNYTTTLHVVNSVTNVILSCFAV